MPDLWDPLILSLQIATTATLLAALTAIPLAHFMARRRFPGKSLVEGLLVVPMALPPTVTGYFLIMLLGSQGWLGHYLFKSFGYSILFRFEGAVLAAMVVALPLLYLPAKAGFASVERELEDSARQMGANQLQVFWHVSLPLAQRGLISGLLLAFTRALGEFGATIMVFGWQANRVTLPISIYADYEQGNLPHAAAAVLALSLISLTLIMLYNRMAASTQQ